MTSPSNQVIPLETIRTDGWLERVAANIGSFDVLCDVLGEPFVAFALITGARVTALTIDRRRPGETLVDFDIGDAEEASSQRLTLDEFRQRLTNALCTPDPIGPPPLHADDITSIQQHIGARYLLLAPLFGLRLDELHLTEKGSSLLVHQQTRSELVSLEDLREILRGHVMQEFYRVDEAPDDRRGEIDLGLVAKAEEASREGRFAAVVEMLSGWMVPLSILIRTPEGHRLEHESRIKLSLALGLLGVALSREDEHIQSLAALRLSVQYALDTAHAGLAYARIGQVLMGQKRFAEAIAPLRRSVNLGGPDAVVWPALARSFLESGRMLAAFGAALEAEHLGASDPEVEAVKNEVLARVPALVAWQALLDPKSDSAASSPP